MSGTLDTTVPYVTFASVVNDLSTVEITIPGVKVVNIVSPIEITLQQFKRAFYYSGADESAYANNLTYYNPINVVSWISPNDSKKLKNILYLNSGGGTVTESVDGNDVIVQLPVKVIDNSEFIIGSFIINDIVEASDSEYESWSYDSQLNLNKKLAAINYIYEFPINIQTTNSLTFEQLEEIVNTTITSYGVSNNKTYTNGAFLAVNLNFLVSFKSTVKTTTVIGGTTEIASQVSDTQFLYQYQVTDWQYKIGN